MPKNPVRSPGDDLVVNRNFDIHKEAIDQLISSPLGQARLISNIEMPDGEVVKIKHGLGARIQSYLTSAPRIPAGASVSVGTTRRGDWELVDSKYIDVAAGSYTFDMSSVGGALDGDTWPFWQIRGHLYNATGNAIRYLIRPNGLARSANFTSRWLKVTGDTDTGSSTNNEAGLGMIAESDADEMRLTVPVTTLKTCFVTAQGYTQTGFPRTFQSFANRFQNEPGALGLITFVGSGSEDTSGSGTPSPTCPTVNAGDLMVLFVANKYSGNSPATPSGWTAPANNSWTGGSGSNGVDSGLVRITIFVKVADGSEDGTTVNVTISGGNASVAAISAYRQTTGTNTWAYSCTGGSDNSVGTSWSVTGAADPDIKDNDWLVCASAINDDDSGPWSSESVSATSATMAAMTERWDQVTSLGDDARLVVADSECTAGDSSAAPVYTMTASSSAGSAPAGATVMIRLRSQAAGTSGGSVDLINAGWSDTSTKMTSLMIGSYDGTTDNQSNSIGQGSWLELYRQATETLSATFGVGMITEVAGADPTKEVWLRADGYGSTITINMVVF